MDDILIRGGQVIDGSGAPARQADVAIAGGRISAIADRCAGRARREIDATGQVVAPGFIDIHTHSDFTLPLNPRAESKIRQGVTTEVLGNCGFSAAPALPGRVEMLRDYLGASAPWLAVPRDDVRGLPRHVSRDRGEHGHAGRPQHPAVDGDGDGGSRARGGRARPDAAPARRGARCRRARALVGIVHRPRHRTRSPRR